MIGMLKNAGIVTRDDRLVDSVSKDVGKSKAGSGDCSMTKLARNGNNLAHSRIRCAQRDFDVSRLEGLGCRLQ